MRAIIQEITNGKTGLVVEFVEAGHSPHTRDARGVSLMQWCAYYGDVNAIQYLMSKGVPLSELGDNNDLNGAVFHGYYQLSRFLLEQGADPNHPLADTGETPLHSVLTKADRPVNAEIVALLLAHGANPNAKTNAGIETGAFMRDVRTRQETPLHRAAAYGDEKTIQLLLDAGADKTIKDMNGDTPLTWASWHLRSRDVLRLLTYGAFTVRLRG